MSESNPKDDLLDCAAGAYSMKRIAANDRAGHFAALGRSRTELPPGVTITRIAEFGALIGDPARIAMLVALLGNEWLPARILADRAGVAPQTASGHLGRLIAGGLVQVRAVGRQRLHGFASDEAKGIVKQLYLAGSTLRRGDGEIAIPSCKDARDCAGHLAGRLAVALADRLLHYDGNIPRFAPPAETQLRSFGLDPETFDSIELCRDWSERRAHFGGRIGHLILRRSLDLRWLRRVPGSAAIVVTPGGIEGFRNRFGINLENQIRCN